MGDGRLKLIVTKDGPAYVPDKDFSLISLTYSSIEVLYHFLNYTKIGPGKTKLRNRPKTPKNNG